MDPLTVFLIATLMMLLNGGVLGLIHRDLPAATRKADRQHQPRAILGAEVSAATESKARLQSQFGGRPGIDSSDLCPQEQSAGSQQKTLAGGGDAP